MKKIIYSKNVAPAYLDNSYSTSVEVEGDSLMIVNKFDVQAPAHVVAASGLDAATAQFDGQVAGMTTDVTIDADVPGVDGNVTLTANSILTIAELVATWNLGNPSNALTISAGIDTQVPTADIALIGGLDAIASNMDIEDFSFSKVAHGMVGGTKVQISTSDTLPDGLVAVTDYYVVKLNANKIALAASYEDAVAGVAIEFADLGVGNQTITMVSLAGASWLLQFSVDCQTWIDVGTANSITVDAVVVYEKANPAYKAIRIKYALTAGQVAMNSYVLIKGEKEE